MYYEEKVINGVLHIRSTPNGEFLPLTSEALTARLMRWYNSDGSFQIMHSPAAVVTLRIEVAKQLETP